MNNATIEPPARLAHLSRALLHIGDMTTAERVALAQTDAWLGYSVAKSALATLEDMLEHPKSPRMRNALVVGESGNGKTTILARLRSRHPPTMLPDGRGIQHVVMMTMPSEPSELRFWADLIAAMGVARNDSGTVQAKMNQAMVLLQNVQCRMLVIDEIHNVLNGTVPRQKQFLATLKNLGGKLMMPIVVAGTEAARRTLATDLQLASRFEPVELPNWKLDDEFASLLASFEKVLPLLERSNLSGTELIIRLHPMSKGRIGRLTRILRQAAVVAIRTGTERVTPEILSGLKFAEIGDT